jgi:hypothetical protein
LIFRASKASIFTVEIMNREQRRSQQQGEEGRSNRNVFAVFAGFVGLSLAATLASTVMLASPVGRVLVLTVTAALLGVARGVAVD